MAKFQHNGVYFTDEHIQQAQANRNQPPFEQAWAYLYDADPTDALASALLRCFRWRFGGNADDGETAAALLTESLQQSKADALFLDEAFATLAQVQAAEMVRGWWTEGLEAALIERVERLNQIDELRFLERLWQCAVNISAGVVFEWDDAFSAGIETFKRTIAEDIHPQGYIPPAVGGKLTGRGRNEFIERDKKEPVTDGTALMRQLLATAALVLSAEAASHAGENLWSYESRGVSVMTPVPYTLYYYHYPERWKWDALPDSDSVKQLYARHGGFFEMVYRRTGFKDLLPMLTDLRPMFDVFGGGLTTLSHGVVPRRGLFG